VIVGIGLDVAALDRFGEAGPELLERLFSPAELAAAAAFSPSRAAEWFAGRFAAKEALAKAIGSPVGLSWLDCQVLPGDDGRPGFEVGGLAAARLAKLGAARVHLSITHDAGLAAAVVVLESADPPLEA
jgi:holo-[acyl-carrier protein] synthase